MATNLNKLLLQAEFLCAVSVDGALRPERAAKLIDFNKLVDEWVFVVHSADCEFLLLLLVHAVLEVALGVAVVHSEHPP